MKKIISCILCLSLFATITFIPVTATEKFVDTKNVEHFCDDLNKMIDEYSDSDYVTPEFVKEEQVSVIVDDEVEVNYHPRLIVQSDNPIETYDAIEVVSGFFNFYILQFENEADTNYAYEQYSIDKDIISVDYDVSYKAVTSSTETMAENVELTYEDYKNGWYMESTGMDKVLEKYENENLPEVVVAVIDSGVDLNNEYLKDRIKPTGFNNAGDGDEGSEQDYLYHGTTVTSVIANCTTDNVKIANYRCISGEGYIESDLLACTAILDAVNDGVIAINCSFGSYNEYNMYDKVLEYAWSMSCPVFSSSGNDGQDNCFLGCNPLTASEYTISVGASTKINSPASFTNYGKFVDILAPGDNMPLISLNDKIEVMSGTSYSSPFMVGVYAMYYVTHPTLSFEEQIRAIKTCGSDATVEQDFVTNYFGSGIVNPLKLFDLDTVEEPQFKVTSGKYIGDTYYSEDYPLNSTVNGLKYIGDITIELSSEDGSDIYYTTDSSYPSPKNGILYEEPIIISDDMVRIRAVAYKDGQRSNYVSQKFCSIVLGTNDMFTIIDNGVITEYKGNVNYLKIPEVINGITVKDISSFSGFDKAEIYGIVLPDTVEYLGWTMDYYDRPTTLDEQIEPFNGSKTLDFMIGTGIKAIGYYGLAFLPNLYEVQFPNCEEIMCAGFYESSIIGAVFPKVKKIDNEAFYNIAKLREIYLPECEYIGNNAFNLAKHLRIIYAPKANYLPNQEFIDETFTYDKPDATQLLFSECNMLARIDLPSLETIGRKFFEKTAVKDVELSNVKYIYDLPDTIEWDNPSISIYSPYYHPVPISLSLPSTLQYCVSAADYKNDYIKYVVYGTGGIGSYAEKWAEENDIEFVNLSPKTAIAEDIETIWDEFSYKPLTFNARGFNRTYQWYGSYDNQIGNDVIISGATKNRFTPDESNEFPYYYCKMISTDINCDGEVVSRFEVFSSLCRNNAVHTHTEEEIPAIAPTCTETGLTAGVKCSECGEIITAQQEILALGHSYKTVVTPPTCTEQGYTTYTCICCDSYVSDYVDALGHNHISVIKTPATHTTTGVITYTCACGDIYTETIDKLAEHNHEAVVTKPTCTKQGYTTYTCECGDNYIDDYVDALGHTPATEVEENYDAPTCTEDGSKDVVVYCSVCSEEISRETAVINPTGHSYTSVVTQPTCAAQGYTTYTCECGDNYVDDYLNATGHADNDGDGYCDADNELIDPSVECDHICHKDGILGFVWRIINVFNMLFGLNQICSCGVAHY